MELQMNKKCVSPDETDKYSLSFDIAEIRLNNLFKSWNNNFPEILLQYSYFSDHSPLSVECG